MAKVLEEEVSRFADPESLEAQVGEYAKLKASIEMLDGRAKALRDKLMAHIEQDGFEDHNGNVLLEFDSPIEGITRIEKQRRSSRALDEGTAETIIEQLGLSEEVYETVRVINEDALMAAYYENKITEAQLDEMFPVKVTWALRTVKK